MTTIEEHQEDYKAGIWKEYSYSELGDWVHNLMKRATHRTNLEKQAKDLDDAKNYAEMIVRKIEEDTRALKE